MDEIINAVINNSGETENKRSYKMYRMYKYTCPNFTVFINKHVIDNTKAENLVTRLTNSMACQSYYEQALMKNITGCKINSNIDVRISMNYDAVIDLSNIYFAIVELRDVRRKITGSINCFCINVKTYSKYAGDSNLQFSAVYLDYSPQQLIIGAKKIFMRLLFHSDKDFLPNALIVYTSFKPVRTNLFKNILCYAFEEFIIVNTEHEQLDLLNYYLATTNANIGAPIEFITIKPPFQCHATKIGYDLICHIDLDNEPLIKNANSFT